jgi:integrase
VSDHLGHTQPSTTSNIYAHTVGDSGIAAALQKSLPAVSS